MTDRRSKHVASAGFLLIRVVAGGTMVASHGWGKLANFAARSGSFPDPLGVGSVASLSLTVSAEVLCALALLLGLFTRLAAIPLLITMAVAAFVVHGDDPFAKQEMAVLYGSVFAMLALTGGGDWSLDGLLAKRRGRGKAAKTRPR